MKKFILCITLTFFTVSIAYSQEKLTINTSKSTIEWFGEYTFYFGGHNGFINFKEGFFIKTKDVITGGEFVIDMNSITNEDIETEKANQNLVNHLKDDDFFDVKKHPLAKIKIIRVEYSDTNNARIEADLTIKGITNYVNFGAEFDYAKKQMKAKFKIDRKQWDVNYTSVYKDGAISDGVGFEVIIKL